MCFKLSNDKINGDKFESLQICHFSNKENIVNNFFASLN